MPTLSTERLLAELTGSSAALAALVDGADLTRPVPTCPDWTLRELVIHVGRAHRWSAEIVRRRSPLPIPFREAPDGKLPGDPAGHPAWLRKGAAGLAGAVRAADDTPVWTQLGPGPAAYWARRMAHETAVHRADAQLAFGQQPLIDADVAADGVDEWLTLAAAYPPLAKGAADVFDGGRSLHFHATDPGLDGTGEWTLSAGPDGLVVGYGHGRGDAAARGPACALLLLLTRRIPAGDPAVEVFGDRALLDAWLAATPF